MIPELRNMTRDELVAAIEKHGGRNLRITGKKRDWTALCETGYVRTAKLVKVTGCRSGTGALRVLLTAVRYEA